MRSLLLSSVAGLALAGVAAAAGWSVEVDDTHGFRLAGLRGEAADNPEHGLMIMCAGGDIAGQIVFAAGPTGDFSVQPGYRTEIIANGEALVAVEVKRNDSAGVEASGDVEDVSAMLSALPSESALTALAGIPGAEMEIAADGLSEALAMFTAACGW